MTDLSKLSNLFNAQQRLTAYNTSSKKRTDEQKNLADMNGDGKIDSKDKTLINKQINEIKKDNPYDFNNDGKTNITDWLLLGDEIDLDGDGTVSDEEKAFIASQKKTMASTVQKSVVSEKYTGEFNGKMYKNGKVLTGFADDGKYYASGSLKTGNVTIKENGKNVSYYFVNGEKAEGSVKSGSTTILYKGGLKYTGINEEDGKCYKDGKLANKVVVDGKYYLNGVASAGTSGGKTYDVNGLANGLVTTTVNKKEVTYMYKDGVKLTGFADDGKYYASGTAKTGNATIKENGKNVSYYFVNGEKANGKVGSYMYKDGLKFTGSADDGLYYANGSLKTGNVVDDKTTTTYKKGEFQYSVTDNNEKDYPNQSGQNIKFKNGTKYTNVKLEVGSTAVINEDGTVEITDKDNNKVKYDSAGNIVEEVEPTPPDNDDEDESDIIQEYDIKELDANTTINVNGKEIKLSIINVESGKITVTENGTINIYNTSSDGKASSIDFKTNEDLKIVIKECKNESFWLNAGDGNDNIVVEEGVSMYSVNGNDGNDNIEIKKNAMLTESVHGDDGDDTITNSGDINHLVGGSGNDTLINTTSGTIRKNFDGGSGNDTLKNYGELTFSMSGNDGDDTLINEASGYVGSIDGFDGDDTIINNGVSGTIKGGRGNDNITNNGISTSINGQAGDDVIDNRGETGSISDYYGNNTLKNEGKHASKISGEQFGLGKDLEANITYKKLYDDFDNKKEEADRIREKYDDDLEKLDSHNIFDDFWKWLKKIFGF